MAKITTKELFDLYFSTLEESTVKKIRMQSDRPELYEYEKKIGKQFVDMNSDELLEMFKTYRTNKNFKNSGVGISTATYKQNSWVYRGIFNYYIDHFEIIKNPFYEKKMKGLEAEKILLQSQDTFTVGKMEKAIANIRNYYASDRADYIECIIRLFYEGFYNASEIVLLEDSMINIKEKTVMLQGRVLRLSDRCFMLLEHVHNMELMAGGRYDFVMAQWQGHYFRYITRESQVSNINRKTVEQLAAVINRVLIVNVKTELNIDINYRKLFTLGFYEYLKKEYGEDKTKEMLLVSHDETLTKTLSDAARKYGIVVDNITQFKSAIRPFVL